MDEMIRIERGPQLTRNDEKNLTQEYSEPSYDERTSKIQIWWDIHGKMLMSVAVVIMIIAAAVWLGYQFWRLFLGLKPVWSTSPIGAVDLKWRHGQVQRLFQEGESPISLFKSGGYPPASYVILWPLLGWLEISSARLLWGLTSIAILLWFINFILKESGASTRLERTFVSLIPLSVYATGATIGNGQLALHVLPLLVFAVLLIRRDRFSWIDDIIASVLLIFCLVKPNISIPFFWIILFSPSKIRLRPAILVIFGYIALTSFAFLQENKTKVSIKIPENSSGINKIKDTLADIVGAVESSGYWGVEYRYADLAAWLSSLNLNELILPAILLVFLALGLWIYIYRNVDSWILLGVVAITTRFWMYHRWYDDLLIMIPLITLFRITKRGSFFKNNNLVSGGLLAITLLSLLAPGGLYLFKTPWNKIYAMGQAIVWMLLLIFLMYQAYHEKTARG
jgi:hypothetical protein